MHTRLVKFSVGQGFESKAHELANELGPLTSIQPGCQAITIFGDHGGGEYGIYVLWDTREHADAAAEVVRPLLDKQLAGKVTAPLEMKLFDVLWSNQL
jgi:hypothetical protein